MYIRFPALDNKSSTCNSQQQTSSSKVTPSNFHHFLRLMPFMGPGGGLEVPPLKSISHVFDKFKVILFLAAQFSMCFTSSIEESLFDLTGALTVISSANLINLLISGCLGFISPTIGEKRNGPMTVPCGTPLLILAYSVMNPSTTTLCFRFVKKRIIELMIYGFRLVCFSFSVTTL